MRKALIFGLILLVATFAGLKLYTNYRAEKTIKTLLERLGIEKKTTYQSVDYSLTTGEVKVRGASIQTEEGKTTIRELILKKITESDLEIYLMGIEGDDEEFNKFKRDLRDLGYRNPVINAHLDLSFYRNKKELYVRDISVEIPEALSMGIKLRIEGIDEKVFELIRDSDPKDREDTAKLVNELQKVVLKNFEITLRDYGFIERAVSREARESGKKPEEVKRELIAKIDKSIPSVDEFGHSLKGALKKMLSEGGSIKFVSNKNVRFDDLVVLSLLSLQSKDLSKFARDLDLKVYYSKE